MYNYNIAIQICIKILYFSNMYIFRPHYHRLTFIKSKMQITLDRINLILRIVRKWGKLNILNRPVLPQDSKCNNAQNNF